MKFKFSFQKVLDVKEKEKDIAQQEYGTVKLRQLELQEKMDGLELTKDKVFAQYNMVDKKTVSEMLDYQQEIEHVNQQMRWLANQKQQLHQEVEQKQQVLLEKSQEAKMWNQWMTKSKDAFQKQIDQKEQAFLDEMAVLRYSRRV
ncbi:flagellar export protein FliJ [Neobacillus jeddahensis]|uniref:flagellar export protein FliJ n=1 Tax=Neobacillus jeddahensis TaxID=1461580 RepID=UPI00059090DC|nr:flagellar export protein FliJ [Neobacillus jeddahensis]